MSTAPRYIPHYTVEDYQHWQGDWELIDGIAVSMTPSPFGPHERIVAELSRQILNQFLDNDCNCRAYSNLDWIVADDTVIRPDLMAVCGDQPERHLERKPDLMVEVLSDATRDRDLTTKETLARENNVPHYLVIDPSERTTLHITAAGEALIRHDETITVELGPDGCHVEIECQRLFD